MHISAKRNVPGPIYHRLAEQAQREHRSLAQQTLAVLSGGLGVEMDAKARRKKVLEAIAALEVVLERNRAGDFMRAIQEADTAAGVRYVLYRLGAPRRSSDSYDGQGTSEGS
jgi:hypothetical protein